ncbi:MAG: methyltransferase [Anaerocolumna sp.]|jgi:SAM-dependent methyltransferase|nr:methyltransferase [Anaerocolumna sp.]
MENNKCFLCNNKDIEVIHYGTRDNNNLNVLRCKNCGLVFLSSFDHIHGDFYENSGMFESERLSIPQWREITKNDDIRRVRMLKQILQGKDILDFGCGNGGFLEYAKEYTNKTFGIEIEKASRDDLNSMGFTVWETINNCSQKFDVITLFHVLEHLENPILYLKEFRYYLNDKKDSQIIIEVPNANEALLSIYNSKPFADYTYWSPHLFLYNHHNIEILAEKADLKINWIEQVQRYPLANHLFWLAEGKPGGHKIWSGFNNEKLTGEYERALKEQNACDTLLFSFSPIC